jgi:ankyrin repeat protein
VPLVDASTAAGRVEVLRFLMAGGVNLGAVDAHKRTVLHLACEQGDTPLVACLMERRRELAQLRQEKKGTKVGGWLVWSWVLWDDCGFRATYHLGDHTHIRWSSSVCSICVFGLHECCWSTVFETMLGTRIFLVMKPPDSAVQPTQHERPVRVSLCFCARPPPHVLWQLSNVDKRLFRNQLDPLDVGAADKDRGWTPLHFAVSRCRFDVAGLLVSQGASVLGTAGVGSGSSNNGGGSGLLLPTSEPPIMPVIDVLPTAPTSSKVRLLRCASASFLLPLAPCRDKA